MQDVPEQAGGAEAGHDASARLSVDLSACLPGRVIRVHGLVTLEVFGHLAPAVGDGTALFEQELEVIIRQSGLRD